MVPSSWAEYLPRAPSSVTTSLLPTSTSAKVKVLCVQEVVTPFYKVTYYIKWGNYFLDTWYIRLRDIYKQLSPGERKAILLKSPVIGAKRESKKWGLMHDIA